MADELNPNAAAPTGDPAESGAESDPGDVGTGEAEPTVAELQARLAEMQRREELLLRAASRGAQPAAEAPVNPPTAPDPRAESALRENQLKRQALEAEIAQLAEQGDKPSRLLMQVKQDRLEDLNSIASALRHMYGQLQELQADATVEPGERAAWKSWYKDHKADYNSINAAKLAFEGHKAIEAAKNPPKPAENGTGGKPVGSPRPVKKVDMGGVSLKPLGAEETRTKVTQIRTIDLESQLAELRAEGKYREADNLAARVGVDLEETD